MESYGDSWGFADEGCWETNHKFGSQQLTKRINGFNSSFKVDFDVTTLWEKLKVGLNRGGNAYWRGHIDDLRIYNITLTSDQVEELGLKIIDNDDS